jgi:uncharacterized membrane protein (DUF2068 family)
MADLNRSETFHLTHPTAERRALQAIAVFEAFKGVAAFAALIGVLDLMHRDVRHLAEELIGRFGLSPDDHYPSLLLHYADLLPGADARMLVALAIGYISLRLAEAYGLWNDLAWGEWLAALSGGVYIPFEINHLIHHPAMINAAVLGSNIIVVAFLVFRLRGRRKQPHVD